MPKYAVRKNPAQNASWNELEGPLMIVPGNKHTQQLLSLLHGDVLFLSLPEITEMYKFFLSIPEAMHLESLPPPQPGEDIAVFLVE